MLQSVGVLLIGILWVAMEGLFWGGLVFVASIPRRLRESRVPYEVEPNEGDIDPRPALDSKQ